MKAARDNHNFFSVNRIHKTMRLINPARPIALKIKLQRFWLTYALKRSIVYISKQALDTLGLFGIVQFPPSVVRICRLRKFHQHLLRV